MATGVQLDSLPQRLVLEDGEAAPLAAQGPAACYICRLPNIPGKYESRASMIRAWLPLVLRVVFYHCRKTKHAKSHK